MVIFDMFSLKGDMVMELFGFFSEVSAWTTCILHENFKQQHCKIFSESAPDWPRAWASVVADVVTENIDSLLFFCKTLCSSTEAWNQRGVEPPSGLLVPCVGLMLGRLLKPLPWFGCSKRNQESKGTTIEPIQWGRKNQNECNRSNRSIVPHFFAFVFLIGSWKRKVSLRQPFLFCAAPPARFDYANARQSFGRRSWRRTGFWFGSCSKKRGVSRIDLELVTLGKSLFNRMTSREFGQNLLSFLVKVLLKPLGLQDHRFVGRCSCAAVRSSDFGSWECLLLELWDSATF